MEHSAPSDINSQPKYIQQSQQQPQSQSSTVVAGILSSPTERTSQVEQDPSQHLTGFPHLDMYPSKNNHQDYTYHSQQLSSPASNTSFSLNNSYYSSGNTSNQSNTSQSPYDTQASDITTGNSIANPNSIANDSSNNIIPQMSYPTQHQTTDSTQLLQQRLPQTQIQRQIPNQLQNQQQDNSVHNQANLFARQLPPAAISPTPSLSTTIASNLSDLTRTGTGQSDGTNLYAPVNRFQGNNQYYGTNSNSQSNINPEFYNQSSQSHINANSPQRQTSTYNTLPSYSHNIQSYGSGYPITSPLVHQPYIQQNLTYPSHGTGNTASAAQDINANNTHSNIGLAGTQNSWGNPASTTYYMSDSQLMSTRSGSLGQNSMNINLPIHTDSSGQLATAAHQYISNNTGASLHQGYQLNPSLQMINTTPNQHMAISAVGGFPPGSTSGVGHIDTNFKIMPLQMGSWHENTTHRIPVKPLILDKTVDIRSFLTEHLVCDQDVNELSPLYISNNQLKKRPTKLSVSSRAQHKLGKFKEKYLTNNISRGFLQPGLSGQSELCRQKFKDNTPLMVGRDDIISEIINAMESASCTEQEAEQHRSGKGDVGIEYAKLEIGRGIPIQQKLPDSISLILGSQQKEEIDSSFISWKPLRTKPEQFFRMEDRHGQTFCLEELKEALDIILSRPPRRSK